MNETVLNWSNFSQFGAPINPYPTPIVLTFNDVLSNFSGEFVFRMELITFTLFGVMLFLQYYTKQIEKEYNKNKKWSEHIENTLRIEPIIPPNIEISKNDELLILISDVLFLPTVAFVLIFIGYETGWFI